MKTGKFFCLLALLTSAGIGTAAWAGGHTRVGVGVSIGVPLGYYGPSYYYGPGYYYPPRYYYPPPYGYYPPPVVLAPAPAPQAYIEQGQDGQTAQLAPGYWYYCADPAGYYPTVKECPGGWQQVAPNSR